MRPSTLLLVTFVIWLTAKKRLGKYWELATTNAADLEGSASGSGGAASITHASALPDFSTSGNPLGSILTIA